MGTLSLLAALALLAAAAPSPKMQCKDGTWQSGGVKSCTDHGGPGPVLHQGAARTALPPADRPRDIPAPESPYSTFGQPHARTPRSPRPLARIRCADGTIQRSTTACESHGGVK